MSWSISIVFFLLSSSAVLAGSKFKVVQEWKQMEFAFPDDDTKQDAETKGFYARDVPVPIDVDVHYKSGGRSRTFVTIPRFSAGVPVTLGVVSRSQRGEGGPQLMPYPNYQWHDNQGSNCDGMTSVFRVAIDECSRLWVLDTGKIGDQLVCPPQLLTFDLETDALLMRYRLPDKVVRPASLFITPILDIRDPELGCRDTFVYMADVTGFGIVVLDVANQDSWRVENKLFFPYPSSGTFRIAGESFDLMDGIFGMTLSPLTRPSADRTLYFHALASVTENYVRTSVIRNSSLWQPPQPAANPRAFEVFKQSRMSQAAAEAIDRSGVMFFGLATPTSIACWDTSTPFGPRSIENVAFDEKTLQFASGVKVIKNLKNQEELWIITCRIQKVMTGTLRSDEVNFRIQAVPIEELVRGTRCEKARQQHYTKIDQTQDNHVGETRNLENVENTEHARIAFPYK